MQKKLMEIYEVAPGKFGANSVIPNPDINADILMKLALSYIRSSERLKIENQNNTGVLNPHTGKPIIRKEPLMSDNGDSKH